MFRNVYYQLELDTQKIERKRNKNAKLPCVSPLIKNQNINLAKKYMSKSNGSFRFCRKNDISSWKFIVFEWRVSAAKCKFVCPRPHKKSVTNAKIMEI